MAANKSNHTDDHLPAPFGLLVAFELAVVVALALAALAVSSFRRPAVKLHAVERLRYEHTMTFEYTAQVASSALYAGGEYRAGDCAARCEDFGRPAAALHPPGEEP